MNSAWAAPDAANLPPMPLDACGLPRHQWCMAETLTNAPEFTVSELSQSVKRSLEDQFGHVRVRGEVSKVARPGSGHLYFDLKDENAVIAAVCWKGVAGRLRFLPEQGLEVIVTGRLTTFPGQSKYQVIVEEVEPAGVGALMALLEERRKKLLAEGLFAPERKQELPYLPQVIGVVTSPTGAVIRDILHRLDDRFPLHVIVWPVRVQGEAAADEIANAINGFNALPEDGPVARPDLLIVARGGGSIEDLWCFNEEVVVRAAAASMIPLISAVGHETDVTLIDHASDRRAPTPTGAAEMAVPVKAELVAYVGDLSQRVRSGISRLAISLKDRLRASGAGLGRPSDLVASHRQRLDLATQRLGSALDAARHKKAIRLAQIAPRLSPSTLKQRLSDRNDRLDTLGRRTDPAARRIVADKRQRLESVARHAASLDPRNVLKRGYAMVEAADGAVISSATAISPGDALSLRFADGALGVTANGEAPMKPKKPAAKKPDSSDDSQSSLF